MLVAVERKPTMDHGGYDGGGQCLLQFFFFFPVQRHQPLFFFPSSFASDWFFSFWSLVFPSVSCSLFPLASSSGFLSEMLGLQWSSRWSFGTATEEEAEGVPFVFHFSSFLPFWILPCCFTLYSHSFSYAFCVFFSFFFMHSSPSVFFFFLPPPAASFLWLL